MSEPVVRLSGVTKRYSETTAVEDLSFAVEEGEFFSILGPSGCGKSTTLRTIAGFESVTDGRIEIGGVDVTETPVHERDTGMVFQGYALFPHKTVGENVGFGLKMEGVPADERETAVTEMLETVDLAGFEDRTPDELSGGQQQRVALARALIIEPSVLLLDEPLAALDLQLRQEMRAELRRIQTRLDTTTIYVTHDQGEALSMSDRILVLNNGRAQQIDTPRALYNNPANEFVAAFIGEANLVQATVREATDEQVRVGADGLGELSVAADGFDRTALSGADSVNLNIRPEDIHILTNGTEVDNSVSATVTDRTFVGKTTKFVTETADGQEMIVEGSGLDAQDLIAPGETVTIGWSADDCTLVPGDG